MTPSTDGVIFFSKNSDIFFMQSLCFFNTGFLY